jgi:hypothetical protein
MRLNSQNAITGALDAPAKTKKITHPHPKKQKFPNEPRKLLKTHKTNRNNPTQLTAPVKPPDQQPAG